MAGYRGITAADLATVVVTHIHLDHAGGVGDIAPMFPPAEVIAHEKGARHLADPSRLMASPRMVRAARSGRIYRHKRTKIMSFEPSAES